ncbi:MAG: glycosyl hydrolase-related protein [Thermoguttaceae bacterium]
MRQIYLAAMLCGLSLVALPSVVPSMAAEDAAKPVRKWVVYLLPHSHVDIGYTDIQPEVERVHREILAKALDLCRKTADYPLGSRFKWNSEVAWPVDSYLRHVSAEKQQQLVDAVRAGQVELHALYANELAGLCRPEELLRLMQRGTAIGRRCGVTVEAAMITDTPGCPWGMVPAMAQAGVKYCALGMNYCHRIGRARIACEDKPFYWLAPDGKQKVLCWTPFMGYALGMVGYKLDQQLPEHLAQLQRQGYPYDIVQLQWCVGSDNGPPDANLPDVVKNWNAKHAYPKMVIATTSELFREFEKRYAAKIPIVRGDFTPYWDDGGSSTARETAINRNAAERLVQAETLWAMFNPRQYPAVEFADAWRNVILYDEHTWGAGNSITEPDKQNVKDSWKIHQAFALDADAQSQKLLSTVLGPRSNRDVACAVDVFNTACWPRTDLVVLSKEMSAAGDVVTGSDGEATASQRLSTGELAFLAKDVPPLAGTRYTIRAGESATHGNAKAGANSISSPGVSVQVDPASGAVVSVRSVAANAELCDMKSGVGLNRYYYVLDGRVKEARQAGAAKIVVKESRPLVASLLVESDAPGCFRLRREIRVIDGLDRVDIMNLLDKKAVRQKESVHLGFAFNVPNGTMRMDVPWAVVRPEIDQIPGACKDWLPVGRWVDVSNPEYGVTWATLDAPMVEVGGLTAEAIGIGPQINPAVWRDKLEPSQTLYSWVMNNYWELCFKAEQGGPTTFRYSLLPHKQYNPLAAQRFGIERSQPLVVTPARGATPDARPLLELDRSEVIVASIKPSDDCRARIVRLFGAGGKTVQVTLHWGRSVPKTVWISNLAEEQGQVVTGPVEVPALGIVTLRAEWP